MPLTLAELQKRVENQNHNATNHNKRRRFLYHNARMKGFSSKEARVLASHSLQTINELLFERDNLVAPERIREFAKEHPDWSIVDISRTLPVSQQRLSEILPERE